MAREIGKLLDSRRTVSVPKSIIQNKNIKTHAFCLFVLLKELYTIKKVDDNIISVYYPELMDYLKLKSHTTLKVALQDLYENGIIHNTFPRFPKNQVLEIRVNSEIFKDETQTTTMPISMFSLVEKVGLIGIRLLWYYESLINRRRKDNYADPAYEEIVKALGLSQPTIGKHNLLLEKYGLLTIERHGLGVDKNYRYDENDRVVFTKINNYYFVNLDQIRELTQTSGGLDD